MYSLAITLSAPDRPLDFRYKSPGGELKLTASSYAFDMMGGNLRIQRPVLRDPHGVTLAKADYVEVLHLYAGPTMGGVVSVKARDVYAKIQRLKSGSLPALSYFPKQTKKPSDVPFHVVVDRIRIDLDDEAGDTPWSQSVSIPKVVVDGLGSQWVADGAANLPGVGTASFRAQGRSEGGFDAQLRAHNLQIGPALRHFSQAPEGQKAPALKDIKADTLTVNGPIQISLRPDAPAALTCEFQVDGTAVQYRSEPRAETAHFKGLLTSTGLSGTLQAKNATADAVFTGSVDWQHGLKIGGSLTARASNPRALGPTVGKLLPKGATFSAGQYQGWLAYEPKTGVSLDGTASARTVGYKDEALAGVQVRSTLDSRSANVILTSATWRGAAVTGNAQFALDKKTVHAAAKAVHVPLGALAAKFGETGVQGSSDVAAIIDGPIAKPNAEFRALGHASYSTQRFKKPFEGDIDAVATLKGDEFDLVRGTVRSKTGILTAQGAVGLTDKSLDLKVIGVGVDLADFYPSLTGTGGVNLVVRGTLSSPTATGRAEAYGLAFRNIQAPIVTADLDVAKDRLVASHVRALSGASEALGSGTWRFKTGEISGEFDAVGLSLADFVDDGVVGTVDLNDGVFGGTIDQPKASASLSGQTIVVGGVKIDQVASNVSLAGKQVAFDDLEAKAADGKVSGSGRYDLDSKIVSADLTATNVAVEKALPVLSSGDTNLDGLMSGHVTLSADSNGLLAASGQGRFDRMILNQTDMGAGPWTLTSANHIVNATLQIGQLDRFVEVTRLAYNLDTKEVSGDFDTLNVELADVFRASQPYLAKAAPAVLERIQSVAGNVVSAGTFSGAWPQLDLQIPSLAIDSIDVNEHPLGGLTADFARRGDVWTVKGLDWKAGDASLNVHGRIDDKAAIAIDGELSKFDLSNLSLIDPNLAGFSGTADLSFLVTGQSKSPEIDASFRSNRFVLSGAGADQPIELGLLLDSIHVAESGVDETGAATGGIQAEGEFTYRGVVGKLTAAIPFNYEKGLATGESLHADIVVADRKLNTLAEFYKGIDEGKTVGDVGGSISVFGPIDALKAEGKVTAKADSFALKTYQSSLKDAQADLTFKNDILSVSLNGKSSAGGDISLAASTKLDDLGQILTSIAEGDERQLLRNGLQGTAAVHHFRISQDGGRENGSVDAVADANLNVTGTLRRPSIVGKVEVSGANVLVPSKPLEQSEPTVPIINPAFDVDLAVVDSAKVRTTAAELAMTGTGHLGGTLSNPDLTANLAVSGGTLRLPSARVRIQPDGSMKLLYQVGPAGDVDARMDVDLEGTTSLTTLRYGDTIARYDITLGVRGDLFKDGGLNLTATSDPPDLSQDRILALLGQTDVLQAFTTGAGVSSQDAQKQVREALTGFALPVLFDPITGRLASSLGLEYLNLEYNAYEEASFAFAKVLGKNLVLQGRRQISEPIVGLRPRYDIELNYRLPVRKGLLSRTSLSIGADQDRPWKIAVEYGIRF